MPYLRRFSFLAFLVALATLVGADHQQEAKHDLAPAARAAADDFIAALEAQDFEHLLKNLFDDEALNELLAETNMELDDLVSAFRDRLGDKDLVEGLKRAVQLPPSQSTLASQDGRKQAVLEFVLDTQIIDRDPESNSPLLRSYFLQLVERNGNYFVYSYGYRRTLAGPVAKQPSKEPQS